MSQPSSIRDPSKIRRWMPVALIGGLWLAFFWPMLLGQTVCSFRDSAYLYYPLFSWIDSVWASGDIPLWNPYCNNGMPVVGDGSSCVFYPGKFVFFCRFLSFESRYGIYLAGHILFAAIGAYWFARELNCNVWGATFAAIAYAFGAPVVFQVTNVIYATGAVWIPIALVCMLRMIEKESLIWAMMSGICVAMLILGGDPQSGYHILMIAMATILIATRKRLRHVGRLALVVCVGGLLAAVQILPILEWSQDSVRNDFDSPRNVYEYVSADDESKKSFSSFLLQEPSSSSHHGDVYQFSQPPWLLAEMIWPNVSGRMFPTHDRWVDGLPGAERVWFPSLYLGFLTVVFALLSFRLFGKQRNTVWLTWIGIVFCFGSFGWYGLGWLLKEISFLPPGSVGSPFGGCYWLFVTVLPKYISFRYPAKLFVIVSLVVAVLAGKTLTRLCDGDVLDRKYVLILAVLVPALMLASFVVAFVSQSNWFADILETLVTANQFGPLQIDEAIRSIFSAAIQVVLISLVLLVLLRLGVGSHVFSVSILFVLAIDILVANYWLTAQVESQCFKSVAPGVKQVDFSKTTSQDRLVEIIDDLRSRGVAKTHLLTPQANQNSFASIEPFSAASMNEFREVPEICFVDQVGDWPDKIYGANDLQKLLQDRRPVVPTEMVGLQMSNESNRIVRVSGQSQSSGWLCRKSVFAPGWKARLIHDETVQELEIRRWQILFQAVKVPAGEWEVEFRYEPQAFWIGASVSGIAWLLIPILIIGTALRLRMIRAR